MIDEVIPPLFHDLDTDLSVAEQLYSARGSQSLAISDILIGRISREIYNWK